MISSFILKFLKSKDLYKEQCINLKLSQFFDNEVFHNKYFHCYFCKNKVLINWRRYSPCTSCKNALVEYVLSPISNNIFSIYINVNGLAINIDKSGKLYNYNDVDITINKILADLLFKHSLNPITFNKLEIIKKLNTISLLL